MTRKLLAGLLGAVAMFVWTSVAHVVLPLGTVGIQEIPNEQPVLAALHSALGESAGLYLFPGQGTPPISMPDYEKKLGANPSGILIYTPPGAKALTPGQLIGEFVTELILCLLAVLLLSQTNVSGFGPRLGFVVLAGVLASLWTNMSYWNWYGFPLVYTACYMGTQIVGFVVAGLVIAGMTKSGR